MKCWYVRRPGATLGRGLHLHVCLQVCLGRFEWDKEPGVHVGRFPLTCGGFIFPHIHIGLMLCLSHASENPGSKALSGPLLSSGNLRCHCRQKKLWKPSNSSGGYYLLYQKKIALLPIATSPLQASAVCLLVMLPLFLPFPVPSFHFSNSLL